MPEKELILYMDGVRAGVVQQTTQGNTTFSYDDGYRHKEEATPISLSMPLTQERHPSRVTVPFLQGLLPDNEARLSWLAAEYGRRLIPLRCSPMSDGMRREQSNYSNPASTPTKIAAYLHQTRRVVNNLH